MSKEKFELVFLAGGAMLNVLSNRLRRAPRTPREEVGAAAHLVGEACTAYAGKLTDAGAARRQLGAVRTELSADRPDPLLLAGYIDELAALVSGVDEVAAPVARLRQAVRGYLG